MWTLVLASLAAFLLFLRGRKQRIPYPPGPKPSPIIGNAFDIPQKEPWIKYKDWSKRLNSDIIHMSAMNTHLVILNKLEDIVELLDKRSTIYSSRPTSRIREMMHLARITSSLPYGDEWRTHRKMGQEGLKKSLIPSYYYIQTERVHIFLGQLLRNPADLVEHCKSLGSSITLAIVFGYDLLAEKHDRLVEMGNSMAKEFGKVAIPGSTLIHVFPFLRHIPPWVPGATTQRILLKVKQIALRYKGEPFDFVKERVATGTSKDCLLANLLEHDCIYDEDVLKEAMATFYLAGGEPLMSAEETFIFTMALNPDKQKKAQEEIDRVVGADRLPDFEDRSSLPYVEALYREVLRWRPPFLLNLPRATVQEDTYKGFYIPKGATILVNIWAITRDETRYHDPDSFIPERFFNEDGSLNSDNSGYVFGFGRRICVARHLVDSLVWLMIASVLAVFDIAKAKDQDGNEIDIDPNGFSDSFPTHPLPYKCSITPRSQQAEGLISTAINAK